jgi:hypothetical protein
VVVGEIFSSRLIIGVFTQPLPTAAPHASKWETIFGQFKALAVKLYIAFWSRAEYLLVSKALFEIQPTREYTAKTFLARLTFEQES